MMMSVIFDEHSAMMTKCINGDVAYDGGPDVVMDGISVRTQRKVRELVQSARHATEGLALRHRPK